MLPGLTSEEFTRLRFSCGTHHGNRPLVPVEMAELFKTALEAGASKKECAQAVDWTTTSMLARFLKLLNLPKVLTKHVSFGGSGNGKIGFSSASELGGVPAKEQTEFGYSIIEHELNKQEVISVRQLLERSGETLSTCVERVVKRRPVIRYLELVVGPIEDPLLKEALAESYQLDRDKLLKKSLTRILENTRGVSGSLGVDSFSLVGRKGFSAMVARLGDPQKKIEAALNQELGLLNAS